MKKDKTHYRDGAVVLYKRERSNKWQARIKIGKGKGSWKRIATGETDVASAAEVACEKHDEHKYRIKLGLAPDSKSFKIVGKMAIKELQEEIDSGYGKRVYEDYIAVIENYLIPFFKNTHIDSIDYKSLIELDNFRKEKLNRTPSKSTLNTHNTALRRVFGVALKNNYISEYQIPNIINTGSKEKTKRRPYLTIEEYRILYRYMRQWCLKGRKQLTRDIRFLMRDYVLIIANTGIRPGTETESLKWKDISEYKAKDGKKYIRMVVSGKTGERELIARHGVRRYLKRIASQFEELKDLENGDLFQVDEYVFRLRDGLQPTRNRLNEAFKQCLSDCGLLYNTKGSKRTLYSLRHSYATFQLLNGISIHLLARQMGTSVNMIEKHYSHIIPSLSAHELGGQYEE